MPFGPVFGALFFGLVCSWVGLGLLGHPQGADRLAGLSLLILGVSLAVGLLRRRSWARWAGIVSALLMGLFALRLVALEGRILDHVTLFGAAVTALLLLVPATGRVEPASPAGGRRDLLRAGVALGILGLLGAGFWTASPVHTASDAASAALPVSAVMQRVKWLDYEQGLDQAGVEGRSVLATFVTDWCPYCAKMDRNTWRASSVIERMTDLVPVRIDGDRRNDLAARYGVNGFPANFLLDGNGKVISRADGYLTSSQLLSWIDKSVGRPTAGRTSAAVLQR